MQSFVIIETTPLSYRIPVDTNSYLIGTTLSLREHTSKFQEWEFNHYYRKWSIVRKYRYYDQQTSKLFLPRYDLPDFLELLERKHINYKINELPLCKGKDVQFNIKPNYKPRNQLQEDTIDVISGVTVSDPVRIIALQTGQGKSYCSIAGLSRIGKRAIIIVPNMIDQWHRVLLEYTDLDKDDIFIIQGHYSLAKLFTQIDKKIFPKIILASIHTLRSYSNGGGDYSNFPSFNDFYQCLNIGVRVIDEAHANFYQNLILDLKSQCEISVFLSATFEHSNKDVARILDGHYPPELRFGENIYKKYVIIQSYGYSLDTQDIPAKYYRRAQGYNQIKFEQWLLKKGRSKLRRILNGVYLPIVNMIYINQCSPGEKLLILASSIDMCKFMKQEIQNEYPDKRVDLFVGNMHEDVLKDIDIVISVPKKAGTGRDIPNLIAMLMTVSARSSPHNKQTLGRLRETKTGKKPIYAYCWCRSIPSHVEHAKNRIMLFQPLALEFQQYNLDPD